jgi:hypothetical protein
VPETVVLRLDIVIDELAGKLSRNAPVPDRVAVAPLTPAVELSEAVT